MQFCERFQTRNNIFGNFCEMAKLHSDPCGSKDSVLWESAEELKEDIETKDITTEVESVFNITEKAKKKGKRRSRRKTKTSDATASKPAPIQETSTICDATKENSNEKNTTTGSLVNDAIQKTFPDSIDKPFTYIPKAAVDGLSYISSNFLFYKHNYMQKGDVVSITDVDGGIYFAQIRKFLTYESFEKGALITWLLPTSTSTCSVEGFDPSTYMIGPEECSPWNMEYMQFVMHLSPVFYTNRDFQIPNANADINRGFA